MCHICSKPTYIKIKQGEFCYKCYKSIQVCQKYVFVLSLMIISYLAQNKKKDGLMKILNKSLFCISITGRKWSSKALDDFLALIIKNQSDNETSSISLQTLQTQNKCVKL